MTARAVARYEYRADDKTGNALKSVRRNVEGVGRSLMGLAGTLAGIAGVGGFGALTKAAIDSGDRVQKLAIRLGASTESLSQLQHVAALSGTDLEAVAKAMQQTQRSAAEAEDGVKQYADAYAALGIDVTRFAKLKPEEQFVILTEALSGVENPARRTALAMDIMGRSGAEMLQIMDGGAPALRGLMAEADALGKTLDQQTANAFAEVNDAMTRFQARSQATGIVIARQVGPTIVALADTLGEILPGAAFAAGQALLKMRQMWSDAVSGIAKAQAWFVENAPLTMRLLGFSAEEQRMMAESFASVGEGFQELSEAYRKEFHENKFVAGEFNAAIDESINLSVVYDENIKKLTRSQQAQAQATVQQTEKIDAFKQAAEEGFGFTSRQMEALEQEFALFDEAASNTWEHMAKGTEQTDDHFKDLRRTVEGWGRDFADTLLDGEMNLRGFAEAVLKEFARIALAKQFEPVFNMFADFLSGAVGDVFGAGGAGQPEARAAGGPVLPGRRYLVGEQGPELLTMGAGGAGAVMPLGGGFSGNAAAPAVNVSIVQNLQSLDPGNALAVVQAGIAQSKGLIVGAVNEAYNRRGQRGPIR